MSYIIASTAVIDEIHFPDGKVMKNLAGGAGIYALAGIKLWSDNVKIATGVGQDYLSIYGEWYKKNNLSTDGLIVKSEKTPHTVINYFENGEREEIPLYGEDHYKSIEITPEELEPYFQTAKGIYIFKNSNEAFWDKVLKFKQNGTAKVMWEIGSDATYFENKEKVKSIASKMDVFSINKTEALALLGVKTVEEAVQEFISWNIALIFFRQGSKGSLMIADGKVSAAQSVEDTTVVDNTGGGNSSSGAVLYGFCEGIEPRKAGIMGSISAAMCLGQFGVPDNIDNKMREAAARLLEDMMLQGGDINVK